MHSYNLYKIIRYNFKLIIKFKNKNKNDYFMKVNLLNSRKNFSYSYNFDVDVDRKLTSFEPAPPNNELLPSYVGT